MLICLITSQFVCSVVCTFHNSDVLTNIMITNVKYSANAKDLKRKERADCQKKKRDNMYDNCTDKVVFHKTLSNQYLKIRHSK